MKVSVCLDAVWRGQDWEQSFQTMKSLGVEAFEFWSWWDKDMERLAQLRQAFDLDIVAFCTKFVSLVDASQREAYITGLQASIQTAERLGCSRLISQVGNEMPGVPREKQFASMTEGLKACVPLLEQSGITLLVEPLNVQVDHQGYFLYRSEEAFELIAQVGSPYVKLLYDVYHQQITEGQLIHNIVQNIDKIGHFHAAGNPGRHELGSGEINYRAVFDAIRNTGYNGYMGLEYFPVHDPKQGIAEALSY